VARNRGYEAIMAVEQLRDKITPHLFVTELRTIAADDLWMSMAYQRDSLAIHFTLQPETEAVNKLLPLIEAKLEPFGARPHWGKVFAIEPAKLQAQYPKLKDFKALLAQHDAKGKFRNEFLDANLYSTTAG
jgi:xylitol oxidase